MPCLCLVNTFALPTLLHTVKPRPLLGDILSGAGFVAVLAAAIISLAAPTLEHGFRWVGLQAVTFFLSAFVGIVLALLGAAVGSRRFLTPTLALLGVCLVFFVVVPRTVSMF